MVQYMKRLFSYDGWANREFAIALESQDPTPQRSLRRLAHILSAERLWLERLENRKQTHAVWPEFSIRQCKSEIEDLSQLWREYLSTLDGAALLQQVNYKNSKGEPWTNQTQDILMHVIMHSAYHRGQIAADFRAAGVTPPYTDFIHGVRQGLVE